MRWKYEPNYEWIRCWDTDGWVEGWVEDESWDGDSIAGGGVVLHWGWSLTGGGIRESNHTRITIWSDYARYEWCPHNWIVA